MVNNTYAEGNGKSKGSLEDRANSWFLTDWGNLVIREVDRKEPCVAKYLCSDGISKCGVYIAAATLRERLPKTLQLIELRERGFYNSSEAEVEIVKDSFRKLVELCELKEREIGRSVRVWLS